MPSHDLTFGVFVPQGWKMELVSIEDPRAKWAKAVEVAQLAEELGFDSLWVYDHFHNVPIPAHETMFEAWTTVAAISQRTSRIKLGQMVGCAPYRNPGLLAKITSSIDVMSGGRLIWGVGAGWYEHEYNAYGYGFRSACCARRSRSSRPCGPNPTSATRASTSPSRARSATRSRSSSRTPRS
jgi:alkanesulfonate monooxygenase SsuD/methylene tetrahydromethanopterin reductase-like flavin-dependent oxidoreductase (luciferase family)